MNTTCKLRYLAIPVLAIGLLGCSVRPRLPAPTAPAAPLPSPPAAGARAYTIVSSESLLTILVFRGGLLAGAGHNHVIASHSLTGTIEVPRDPLRATFEVHMPLGELTIDEPTLRAAQHREDFPPEVPESARQGTRTNMLSAALLDAAHWPEIVLRSARLEPQGSSEVLASVQVTVRGEQHQIKVPIRYELQGEQLTVSGAFPLKQSELGLTPYSALMGALTVQDEMHVQFQLRAHTASAPN